MSIQVLIADDHPIVRKGLRKLLEIETDMQVVAEACEGMEALEQVRRLQPDVVLLDIAMPRLTGLEVAQMLGRVAPRTKVVILSMHDKEAYARQALEAGVKGYVLKGGPSEDIPAAIRAVYQGGYFLSPPINSSVISSYLESRQEKPRDQGYQSLSERERQVFLLLVEGNSTAQISETLCISPKTVEKHRTNVLVKLGLSNSVELAKFAVRAGLVDPELWKS